LLSVYGEKSIKKLLFAQKRLKFANEAFLKKENAMTMNPKKK